MVLVCDGVACGEASSHPASRVVMGDILRTLARDGLNRRIIGQTANFGGRKALFWNVLQFFVCQA